MKNYLSVLDSAGNFTAPEWVVNSLDDLDRFIDAGGKVEKIVGEMEEEGCKPEYLEFLREFSEDFYTAWLASSTELIGKIGFDEACKIFAALKKIFFISWPSEMIDIGNMYHGEIEIFRGESLNSFESDAVGLSWTTHVSIAKNFKDRREDGVLLRGTISKDEVWAFYGDESEVVAFPDYVKNLSVC